MTAKPLPVPTSETRAYWSGGAVGELRYSWCSTCSRSLFPPRAFCRCGGETEWRISAGLGSIHSFTVVERAPLESFRADVPYTIALVDLDEGFRIMINLRGGTPAHDLRVVIVFERLGDDIWLPQAQIASPQQSE